MKNKINYKKKSNLLLKLILRRETLHTLLRFPLILKLLNSLKVLNIFEIDIAPYNLHFSYQFLKKLVQRILIIKGITVHFLRIFQQSLEPNDNFFQYI